MEKALLNKALLWCGKHRKNVRLFRNNTGLGWVGDIVKRTKTVIVLQNYRPFHAGLVVGGTDLVGWTTVEITPDMVGKKIAVFTGVEGKDGTTTVKDAQKKFATNVTEAGGYCFIIRPSDFEEELTNNLPAQ